MAAVHAMMMGIGKTSADFSEEDIGTFIEGGYYAGKINVGGVIYAIILAPKSQGGQSPTTLQWKTSNTSTANTDSINDGKANTAAMVAAGAAAHPAASFCNSLEINGYSDWYLPSKDELEILYRAFKPTTRANSTSSGTNTSSIPPRTAYTALDPAQTSLEIFKAGGSEALNSDNYCWSSTQYSATHSWFQYFDNGYQDVFTKSNSFLVRAVRRVAL